MKTVFFLLLMATPDGNLWTMDSGLTQEDCGKAIAAGFSGYVDERNGWHDIPDGAAYICKPEDER